MSEYTKGFRDGRAAGIAATKSMDKWCRWNEDSDGMYNTECGRLWFFDTGNVKENGAKFCVYCGRRIKEIRYKDKG